MSKQVDLSWNDFKTISMSKNLVMQYEDLGSTYDVFFVENEILWQASLLKGTADAVEFETDFLPSSNARSKQYVIIQDGNSNLLTSTPFSPKQALDVNIAGSTGYVKISRYRPRFYTDKTIISVSQASDTQLASINFDGQISGISVNFNKKEVDFILIVDNVEVLRVNLKDLEESSTYDLKHEHKQDFSIKTYGGHIFITWNNTPPDILTNLIVKAKATASNVSAKGTVIVYRERVI